MDEKYYEDHFLKENFLETKSENHNFMRTKNIFNPKNYNTRKQCVSVGVKSSLKYFKK